MERCGVINDYVLSIDIAILDDSIAIKITIRKSRYQISKETGIDEAVLCRIVTGSGTGSCSTKTADILCKYFGLELEAKKTKKRTR